MTAPPSSPAPRRSRAWPAAFAVVMLALIALAGFTLHEMAAIPGRTADWVEHAAGRLGGLFGTTVHVDNASFTLEQKEITELATVQRRFVCTTRYDVSSWGSNATVILRGTYRAKAGFDLRQGSHFTLDPATHVLTAQLPPARLLSLTTENQQVYFASEGLLQKIGPQEMEKAYAQNLAQARREAVSYGLVKDAEDRLQERLTDLLSDENVKVRLQPLPKVAP
jgi:hypothetical protein